MRLIGAPSLFRSHRTVRLRLVLALLLAWLPPLSTAQVATFTVPGGSAEPAVVMPCHAQQAPDTQMTDSEQVRECPHCSGDTAVTPCGCNGPLGAAGLADQGLNPVAPFGIRVLPAGLAQAALPESPPESLYRPPIIHA